MRYELLLLSAVAMNGAAVLAAPQKRQGMVFPAACSAICGPFQTVISQCGSTAQGATCLCKQTIVTQMHDCFECAVENTGGADQGPAVQSAQSTMDQLIRECKKASITLMPTPITSVLGGAVSTVSLAAVTTMTGSDSLTPTESATTSSLVVTTPISSSTPASVSIGSNSGVVLTVPATTGTTSAAGASITPAASGNAAMGKPIGMGAAVIAFALTLVTLL